MLAAAAEEPQSSTTTTTSDDDLRPNNPPPSNPTRPRPPKIDVGNHTTYTSLRDLVVESSPTCYLPDGGIAFRNPLLKHAAHAYLQPRQSPGSFADDDRSCCWSSRLRWPDDGDDGDDPSSGCVGCVYHVLDFLFPDRRTTTDP